MTSVLSSRASCCLFRIQDDSCTNRFDKFHCLGSSEVNLFGRGISSGRRKYLVSFHGRRKKSASWLSRALADDLGPAEEDKGNEEEQSPRSSDEGSSEMFRQNLEKIVGKDDSSFTGVDLAALIRNKYGRSYDVQLIKKEFMGRSLLAMNVMWKYREQRSFPLTEEEYLLRLDDVANNLKCWGAVSHIRNSFAKLKERPRIGKAVSIFIDMDETGGRSDEWIYK
ncbi:hypothetical protein H6P81_018161 [Aristolochia fimbriata]|uniref:Uncharacterized protein n=1 Tax=Aristolochia fimbriata TaxID=158543 RepID=A0AAV7E3B5_ARIFI|nr:hypothetical protein H6P81_018161 [Aristolochia fimbriata]